ncbi:MAG: acyl-CoA reductase [Flavobacteriales bacterium Tduv]
MGAFLRYFGGDDDVSGLEYFVKPFKELKRDLHQKNPWFTIDNVSFALRKWGELLKEEKLFNWVREYDLPVKQTKNVAIIMAGNIPLVGFHDFLCVLLSGNRSLIKTASGDDQILAFLCRALVVLEPVLEERIIFVDFPLKGFDAVIATGSNNTARYFEHYFRGSPQLIRKNRVSAAVLQGYESQEDLYGLVQDILRYFGRGCRSVSKVFIPLHYDLAGIFQVFNGESTVMGNSKYARNYDYYRAIYLLDEVSFKETGISLLREDTAYHSPISVLFYEYYDDLQNVRERLERDRHLLQCVVGRGVFRGEIPFGQAQCPTLTDYADGVDTMRFLEKL